MPAFPRFDPYAVLAEAKNRNRGGRPPAKVANPAKVGGAEAGTLATLATLAAATSKIENPHRRPKAETEPVPATVIAPVQWFEAEPPAAEPPYDQPCPARRGVIRHPRGRFEHFCAVCGGWGAFGFGVTGDAPGRWYCFRHRPQS